mgnify:CR=1 FL=1
MGYGCCVRIKGDMALFTRPEEKAERVSYSVITPSAARGIIEAVYWHPGMRYVIDRITVLKPIRFDSIRRNELGAVAKLGSIRSAAKSGGDYHLDINENRQQRASMYLRNVDYLVDFHFELAQDQMNQTDDEKKFYNILLRRLRGGQHYHKPYMGCREFPANVELVEGERPESAYRDLEEMDLGFMLYDIEYGDICEPRFFHAIMRRGVIEPEVIA